MADGTGIVWTDATWGPVTGCTKVSAGCKHCYAERDWSRLAVSEKTVYFGRAFTDVACHPERLDQPLRWTRPRMIFVNSMSDLFHELVPESFLDKVFAIMGLCHLTGRKHVFQVLTKRHGRMAEYLLDPSAPARIAAAMAQLAPSQGMVDVASFWPFPNVWLGVSIENQTEAVPRLEALLRTPAAVHWVSAEPLLGELTLPDFAVRGMPETGYRIQWCVVGGESGPKARPLNIAWVRALRDQCQAVGIAFLFKQWGEYIPGRLVGLTPSPLYEEHAGLPFSEVVDFDGLGRSAAALRVGTGSSGRTLDGLQYDEYPQSIY